MNHPLNPAIATPEAREKHSECPDCGYCGSRLHCWHQCGNYHIFKRPL